MSTADSIAWTDIARIANLAEAGFLADELNGLGVRARIHQLDEFNAASDRWSAKYLIQVEAEQAEYAADHLKQYLFEEEVGQPPILDAFRRSVGRGSNDLLSWRGVLLAALAGVVGFAYGQQFAPQNSLRRSPDDRLATAVETIGRPFFTEPVANQPRYCLSFDRPNQQWTIATDRGHDGAFIETQHFPATLSGR